MIYLQILNHALGRGDSKGLQKKIPAFDGKIFVQAALALSLAISFMIDCAKSLRASLSFVEPVNFMGVP